MIRSLNTFAVVEILIHLDSKGFSDNLRCLLVPGGDHVDVRDMATVRVLELDQGIGDLTKAMRTSLYNTESLHLGQ